MNRIMTSPPSPAGLVRRLIVRSAMAGVPALAISLIALAGAAGANHSRFEHLSAGEVNGNGAFDAGFRAASADGSRIVFATGEQLVGADTDSSQDVYERSGGQTRLVSAGAINGNGVFNATFRDASTDGSRVFFTTFEQLVPGDSDSSQDVYERSGAQTRLVSAGAINGNGVFNAFIQGVSADGARVFFNTNEQLVSGDTDAVTDVYQRAGGTTKRVSVGAINGNGAFDASFSGTSADGSRAFLLTEERLVSGDTDTAQDVYERSGGTTKLVSAGAINGNGAFAADLIGTSADGARVFFETNEPLVSADGDSARDIYRRSEGTTTRISPGNGAFDANFEAASADGTRVWFQTDEKLVGADTDSSGDIYESSGGKTQLRSLGQVGGNGPFDASFVGASADGSRVFFETAEQLVPELDGAKDVFERSNGSTKLISGGPGGAPSGTPASFVGASADGSRVFFETTEDIVAADTDLAQDVYERFGGATSKVSPGNGDFDADLGATSADGSALVLTTRETMIASDEDSAIDIYGGYTVP